MSIELFNAGLQGADEVTAKLNNVVNQSFENEVDLMFGRLHEQTEKAKSPTGGYGTSNSTSSDTKYEKDKYERVGFKSRQDARQFVQKMESWGVEVTLSPVKLNGQYLAEIPKENTIPSRIAAQLEQEEQNNEKKEENSSDNAFSENSHSESNPVPTPSAPEMETVSAKQLIGDYKAETFGNVEEVKPLQDVQAQSTVNTEVNAFASYMERNLDYLGATIAKIGALGDMAEQYGASANKNIFKNEVREDGRPDFQAGRRTETATVINNDTVIINGNVVTDERTRNYVLRQHEQRMEKAKKYAEREQTRYAEKKAKFEGKQEQKKTEWLAQNPSKTEADWAKTHQGKKEFKYNEKHETLRQSSQSILDNAYRQEYLAPEVKNYASRTGGTLDALVKGVNTDAAALSQEKRVHLTADESALISKVAASPVGKQFQSTLSDVVKGNDIFTFRERLAAKSMFAAALQQNVLSSKIDSVLKKHEDALKASPKLSADEKKKLADKLVKELKAESLKVKYDSTISRPLYELTQKFEKGEIDFKALKSEAAKIRDKEVRFSDDEKKTLESLYSKKDGKESGKLTFSAEESSMLTGSTKIIDAFKNDLGVDLSNGITRDGILKANETFINRAASKGYQFVTVDMKFDVKMLQNLKKEDLMKLGISETTRDALVKLNTKGAWGGKNADLQHTGIGNMLAQQGLKLVGDEDLNSIITNSRKTYSYSKKAATSVKQAKDAAAKRVQAFKAKHAGTEEKAASKAKKKIKKVKQKIGQARAVNQKRNEKYIKKQQKKAEKLKKRENSFIGKTRKKINKIKQKIANNPISRLVNEVKRKLMSLAVKIIAIFFLVLLVLIGFIVVAAVVITGISSLLNALKGTLELITPDYFDQSASYKLSKDLEQQEDSWIDEVRDLGGTFKNRTELKFGMDYEDYYTYIGNNFPELSDGGDGIEINPFWASGNDQYEEEIENYNGEKVISFSANINAYGKKDIVDEYGAYVSTESGHTSNLKDIIAMCDVMYDFQTDEANDGYLDELLGMTPAQLDWENFKTNVRGLLKWAKENIESWWESLWGGEEPEYVTLGDVTDPSVTYKTLENYTTYLFESSHQRQFTYDVTYHTRDEIRGVKISVNGENMEFTPDGDYENAEDEYNASVAYGLGICSDPVSNIIKIFWDSSEGEVAPYIEDSSGVKHNLGVGEYEQDVTMEDLTHSDENVCLWTGMGSNRNTLNKIKAHMEKASDSLKSSCWELEENTRQNRRNFSSTTNNGYGSGYYEDISDALKDAINNANTEWNKYQTGEKTFTGERFTLSDDKNTFVHRYTTLYDYDESSPVFVSPGSSYTGNADISYSYESKVVESKTEKVWKNQYWTTSTGGSLTTDKDEADGLQAYYLYVVQGNSKEERLGNMKGIENISLDDYSSTEAWLNVLKSKGLIKTWWYTDSTYLNVTNENDDGTLTLEYYDNLDGWSCKTKKIYNVKSFTTVCKVAAQAKVAKQISVYKVTASVHFSDYHVDTYIRDCSGHSFTYCGGHVSIYAQGIVYSVTNEQMAMVGAYSDESQLPVIKDFDFAAYGYEKLKGKYDEFSDVDYSTAKTASTTGGSVSPLVDVQGSYAAQRGLNLYMNGESWQSGYKVRDDFTSYIHIIRDIFDVDCLIDKGKNVFAYKGSDAYTKYKGWNADNMSLVITRITVDWYGMYGFDIRSEIGEDAIGDEDIDKIIDALEDSESLSETRKEAVKLALSWVGRGHYNANHTDHAFLSELCEGSTVTRTIGSETTSTSIEANCTASDSEGFAKYILNYIGKMNNISGSISGSDYTGLSSAEPGDIIYHKVDNGYINRKNYTNIDFSVEDFSTLQNGKKIRDTIKAFITPTYVIYIGTLEEDVEITGMGVVKDGETKSVVLEAGSVLTVDLSLYDSIGVIRLRTDTASEWSNLWEDNTYYFVTNPDMYTRIKKID